MTDYKKGDITTGTVTGIEDYGAFISLKDNYTGLVHISEISTGFVSDIRDYFKEGDTVEAKIIDVDNKDKKIKLSIKYRTKDEDYNKTIKEVGSGFEVLKDNLDGWISDKIREING